MRVALLLAAVLSATVIPQSIEQLTDRATLVVRATVGEPVSAADSGPAGISTVTPLQVTEVLKGTPPADLRVRQTGGTVGNRRLELPGDAVLHRGEDVLVFLRCAPERADCTLVGLAQGKFHLSPTTGGGLQASRDFSQLEFVRGPPPSAGPEPYAALAQRIRQRAGASR